MTFDCSTVADVVGPRTCRTLRFKNTSQRGLTWASKVPNRMALETLHFGIETIAVWYFGLE